MNQKFENGLFIFHRDLRIVDNNALNLLSEMCKNVYTIFIFTPEQISSSNKYKSNNAIQFMIESLQDLEKQIHNKGGKLYVFYGKDNKIIANFINTCKIDIVSFNLDYSPFARERDNKIIKLCEKMETYVIYDYDYYLFDPFTVLNGSGQSYQKFTPFYENAIRHKIKEPIKLKKINFKHNNSFMSNILSLNDAMHRFTKINHNILVHGGRNNALICLNNAVKSQTHYIKTRDDISKHTSLLSAYIKFGCLSIREVYKTFKNNRSFIRQLYWRDFYALILYHYPHVLGKAMKPNYDKIKWHYNEKWFKSWCNGTTGMPILDASMRQLNECGWTHNRGRMIASSMLTKIFLIDWRLGEKYYATHLTDYDPANNNGGWQWSSGTGADSQPYFRIFNPYTQSKEHDPDCEYIKKWIPELKNIPNEVIHNWDKEYENFKNVTKYPKPIVDYVEQKEKALKMYNDAL
jgi:deoxyribodipyrimidine photo-lyase